MTEGITYSKKLQKRLSAAYTSGNTSAATSTTATDNDSYALSSFLLAPFYLFISKCLSIVRYTILLSEAGPIVKIIRQWKKFSEGQKRKRRRKREEVITTSIACLTGRLSTNPKGWSHRSTSLLTLRFSMNPIFCKQSKICPPHKFMMLGLESFTCVKL